MLTAPMAIYVRKIYTRRIVDVDMKKQGGRVCRLKFIICFGMSEAISCSERISVLLQ